MKKVDYYELFISLGIDVAPLDSSYNPDDYGKMLMLNHQVLKDVTYSANTNIKNNEAGEKMNNITQKDKY